jgi:hypothetical protein
MHSRASIAFVASALIAGVAGAQSTQAVEWKVSDGGNGHWYQFVRSYEAGVCWTAARDAAALAGGYLATITSSSENAFATQVVQAQSHLGLEAGPFLGATCEGRAWGDWIWVTGEPFSFTSWNSGEPNSGGGERFVHMFRWEGGLGWNDTQNCSAGHFSYLIEWSADCNGDGIVDYGQILSGQLIDLNSNGVPDVCETSISSVIPPSVPAQGGSAIIIRGNFPPNPTVLIGGVPATEVTRVSVSEIRAKTPALLPGMASVKVNDFMLVEALYIRPECGSDLDQDGEVTAADIAIVLLDFGPCYATVTGPQSGESTPFMLQEQPAATAPQSR